MDIIIMKKYNFHYSFIAMLIFAIMIGLLKEILFILLTLSLHEFGHLLFLKMFNYRIDKITFFPLGGVIVYENKNDFIYKSLFITFGGIFINFVFYMLFKLFGLVLLSKINLYFLVINLIPIYPLDGGGILFLLLSMFIPYKTSKYVIHYFSLLLSVVFLYLIITKNSGIYLYFIIAFLLL